MEYYDVYADYKKPWVLGEVIDNAQVKRDLHELREGIKGAHDISGNRVIDYLYRELNHKRGQFNRARVYFQKLVWYRRCGVIPGDYWNQKGRFDALNFAKVLEVYDFANWEQIKKDGDVYHDPNKTLEENNRDSCYVWMQTHCGYIPDTRYITLPIKQ